MVLTFCNISIRNKKDIYENVNAFSNGSQLRDQNGEKIYAKMQSNESRIQCLNFEISKTAVIE